MKIINVRRFGRTVLPLLLVLALAGCIAPIPAAPAAPAAGPAAPAAPAVPAAPAAGAADELTYEELANATYQGIYEEPVTLVDGVYEGEPFVEGGASKPTVTLIPQPIAQGDLNGDGAADAAVLLSENSGGSGTFIYLAAVLNEAGAPQNTATTLLGDRIQVQTLTIDGPRINVGALTFAEGDPECCPSQPATLVYELQGDQLVEITE